MNSRELLNRIAAPLGYQLERTSGDRIAGRDLHRDINLMLKGRPRPLIFDLGANEGQSVRHFLRDFHEPRIISFEPCAGTFAQLEARFAGHPGVQLVRAAVGEADGEAELNVFAKSEMNSLSALREDTDLAAVGAAELSIQSRERVEVVSLDSFCAKNEIGQIDLLKMDCQGAEMGILRGAIRLLRERRIRLLYLEVLFRPLYANQASLEDYIAFLKPLGLELTGFYRQAFRGQSLFHADVLFHLKA